jgi:predicted O-methyltransferase YrrM
MQLQPMMGLLLASASAVSLGVAGCTQQREFEVEAQEPAFNVQTQAPAPTVQPQEKTAPDIQTEQRQPDVPYVPTPNEVVAQMLALAKVKGDDVLYDLGSGDGRIVITAAQKFGTRGVGVDINPERIKDANENAQKAGVTDRVKFLQQDLLQTDISEATVITLYLLPDINLKLRPELFRQLKPGTRIVSHDFDMGEWKPERVVQVQGPVRQHTLYYWVVPENVPNNLR